MDPLVVNLVANLLGKARKHTVNGRDYLVAPVASIVPGVLGGSRGLLYYPADEVGRNPAVWNGMPIVVYHPKNSYGDFTSARDPDILREWGVGTLYRSTFDGKLRHEGWFDVADLNRVDNKLSEKVRIRPRLEKGEPVELSTGLFLDTVEEGGTFNGRAYTHVTKNYVPDHLAVLPDEVGACSTADGCGVCVNQGEDDARKATTWLGHLWKYLTLQGASTADLLVPNARLSHDELRTQLSKAVEERFGNGLSGVSSYAPSSCYLCDVYDKEVVFMKQDRMFKAGYTTDLRKGTVTLKDGPPVEVMRTSVYKPVENVEVPVRDAECSSPESGYEELELPTPTPSPTPNNPGEENTMNREAVINWLVTNCDCWKGAQDKDTLNKLTDDKLNALKAAAEKAQREEAVVNAARKGFTDLGGNTHTWNDSTQRWETKAPVPTPSPTGTGSVTVNTPALPTPATPQLTPEQQEDLEFARVEKNRQKTAIVNQLTANVADADKPSRAQWLQGKSLAELQTLASLLPPPPARQADNGLPQPLWLGAGTPPTSVVNVQKDPDDVLLPTWEQTEA